MNFIEMLEDNTRILIVKLSSIGDVLHSTPTVHNLRLKYPKIHISWLVSPPASILLQENTDVDELIIWDRRIFDAAAYKADLITVYRTLKNAYQILNKKIFDIVIDIQGLLLTGILSCMSGAPRRIGIHERHEGNSFFMTEMADDTQEKHKVLRYMTALRPFKIYDFVQDLILNIPQNLENFAEKFLISHGINFENPILFVNVRTSWQTKNWSPEFYVEALCEVSSNVQIIFCGSKEDNIIIEQIQKKLTKKSLSTSGEVNLLELAALFKKGTLLLTCDTGPLYIAEAVGLKTLSLWGATDPKMFGPLTSGHSFIITDNECRFCCKTRCKLKSNACMNAIKPKIVAQKLNSLLK